MSDWAPTTQEVRTSYGAAVTFPTMSLPERRRAFDRWLKQVQAEAIANVADEAEQIIRSGDVAEVAAYVPGESGRQSAIDHRDALLEDPVAWLRQHAQNVEDRQETEA